MKKLAFFITVLLIGIVSFSTSVFAAEPLLNDLYISEISVSPKLDEKYVEIFVNKKIVSENYFIMTARSGNDNFSTGYKLEGLASQDAGTYYVFTGVKTGLSLTNTNDVRILYLCQGDQSKVINKEACQANPIDFFAYEHLLNTDHSWSRDFDSEDLSIKEAVKTQGYANDFKVNTENGDGDEDEDDTTRALQHCNKLVMSEISSVEQWIEVYNNSDITILPANITDCYIGVQSGDASSGGLRKYSYYNISNFLNFTTIGKYEYVVLDLTKIEQKNKILPNSSGIKDRSVIMADDDTDYDYNAIYKSQKEGTSLSYFADGWKITYAPTPGAENIYQQWQTCEAGKHINEATGNCVKDTDPPAECAEGQYRNPETGRCKKYPEEKVLAECAEGQYRNPLTNRCKKISTSDDLVPCAEGYERNPETNRCRKIRASDSAEYAIDPMGVSTENRTWAIIGAVGLGAIGLLIAVQFRHEIAQGFNKLFRRKK